MPEEIENDVEQDSSPEVETEVREDVTTPVDPAPQSKVEKTVPYSRFKNVNDELTKLKSKPAPAESPVKALEFVKLGKKLQEYSDEEIDFAVAHAKSQDPDEILKALNDEMVQLAIQAKREKVDKEKSLKPSGTQPVEDRPRKLSEVLNDPKVPQDEKEKLMKQFGLYKDPGSPPTSARRVLMP
jgi:hypothetical protein